MVTTRAPTPTDEAAVAPVAADMEAVAVDVAAAEAIRRISKMDINRMGISKITPTEEAAVEVAADIKATMALMQQEVVTTGIETACRIPLFPILSSGMKIGTTAGPMVVTSKTVTRVQHVNNLRVGMYGRRPERT